MIVFWIIFWLWIAYVIVRFTPVLIRLVIYLILLPFRPFFWAWAAALLGMEALVGWLAQRWTEQPRGASPGARLEAQAVGPGGGPMAVKARRVRGELVVDLE